MRLVLLAASASLMVGIATFACSSAQPAAATDPDAGSSQLPTDDTSKEETPDPESSTPTPADSGSDGDTPTDGGLGSTEGDAGSRCLPTSIRESETNNDVASADPIPAQTGTYCGRILAGDVDFMTFTMPNQVNTFNFSIDSTTSNQLRIDPSADGEPFNFNSNNYPFKPGKPYVLKISSNGQPLEYRIKITINQ